MAQWVNPLALPRVLRCWVQTPGFLTMPINDWLPPHVMGSHLPVTVGSSDKTRGNLWKNPDRHDSLRYDPFGSEGSLSGPV